MARRFAFWVILDGNTPTAFRSSRQDTLIPTLRQLQRTQPYVSLRWFERNRLWDSPAEADAAQRQLRERRRKPAGWRPGGTHEDPRARFKRTRDQKRADFKRRHSSARPPGARPAAKPVGRKGPKR